LIPDDLLVLPAASSIVKRERCLAAPGAAVYVPGIQSDAANRKPRAI
jgi:hypothetical protein